MATTPNQSIGRPTGSPAASPDANRPNPSGPSPIGTDATVSPKSAVKLGRVAPVAACLGVASFLVLVPAGYPIAAVLFCGGLALGLFNVALVQRSAARFAASENALKRRFAMSALARLALISAVAVALALALRPQGLAVFAGLAACQLLMIFTAAVPLVRELRQAQFEVSHDK
jgi:hypothetical protein